jgi:hypothetical protein
MLEPYDPYKHGVTQGLLTTFMRCREEARNHLSGLEQIRTSAALQFGSLTHRVLELTYLNSKKAPSAQSVLAQLESVRRKFLEEEGGSRLGVEGMENLETNCSILKAVLPEYFKFYKKDFETQKWLELENKFKVPSPVPGIFLVGRIDGAFNQKKELWLFESKTKGRIEEDSLIDTLAFDFQNNVYQYALRKKYNRTPDGVLYNIIRRPGQRVKKDESLKQFGERIGEEVQKDPSYYFIRFEVAIPRSELKRFESELTIVIQEFVSWWKGEIKTYRNTSACMQKFGPCRFLPKCANNDTGMYRKREVLFPELVD